MKSFFSKKVQKEFSDTVADLAAIILLGSGLFYIVLFLIFFTLISSIPLIWLVVGSIILSFFSDEVLSRTNYFILFHLLILPLVVPFYVISFFIRVYYVISLPSDFKYDINEFFYNTKFDDYKTLKTKK